MPLKVLDDLILFLPESPLRPLSPSLQACVPAPGSVPAGFESLSHPFMVHLRQLVVAELLSGPKGCRAEPHNHRIERIITELGKPCI